MGANGCSVPRFISIYHKKEVFYVFNYQTKSYLDQTKIITVTMRISSTNLFRLKLQYILEPINKIILTGKYQSESTTEAGDGVNITHIPWIPYKGRRLKCMLGRKLEVLLEQSIW